MDPRKTPPRPIIDNLDFIDNPFKIRVFSSQPFIDGQSLGGADRDLEYALKFLYSYNGSSATFNSYRREIERLLQWAWRIEGTAVIPLRREQIEEFIRFCSDPPLAWIGIKNVARFKTRPGGRLPCEEWRPFVASVSKSEHKAGIEPSAKHFYPSQAAIMATFTALSSFYKYLVQEDLIEANPVSLIRQKSKFIRKDQLRAPVRRISNLQWDYVLETAERMAGEDPQHERTLFIMNCLFAMYLRISELVADERSIPAMGDFRKDLDGNWWFHVTGKGNKNRSITVCDAMLQALKRYRKYLGLPPLPNPGERVPLISKTLGRGPVTSSRNIRKIVQTCFDRSYERMCAEGLEEDAGELKAATVHWLRHTGISEDVKFRPREHVRDDAGHASMATTDRYIESDLRERHQSAKRKRIKDL
jgi:site-specific recombinase XerC